MKKDINDHVFEVRYKANPIILDHRGGWAEKIAEHMDLPQWTILDNRVDIYDKSNITHAFVGFRNSGFTTIDSPTKNYFYDQAIKFFSFVSNLDGFGKKILVERIGVRSKFFSNYENGFEDLRSRYASRYLCLTKEAEKAINGKLIDIGGPLNFADHLGNFNTMSGPMERKQALVFFSNRKEDEVPDAGFYYDIDYWLKPEKIMESSDITANLRNFAIAAWERQERVKDLLFKA